MLLLVSSCAPQRHPMPGDAGGQPLDQVYNQTRGEGLHAGADALRRELTIQGTLGYVRPGVPVRTPPNVMAVWIPAFVNTEGDMVSGHWVYMVRQQEKWFIEEETGPGTAAVTVPRSSPRPRRSATVPPERPLGSPLATILLCGDLLQGAAELLKFGGQAPLFVAAAHVPLGLREQRVLEHCILGHELTCEQTPFAVRQDRDPCYQRWERDGRLGAG